MKLELDATKLFETTSIKKLMLKNRFVRSATNEGMAGENGAPTQQLINHLKDLADGGVGLIISGFSYVSKNGKGRTKLLGIHSDVLIREHKKLTDIVHNNGSKIIMQLAHAGCRSKIYRNGEEPFGPSTMSFSKGISCREITLEEIPFVIDNFVKAATRAKNSGFDGIQLHGAHGFLINQFLSPFYNKRTDEYGGTIENRARFILEILTGIRAQLGDTFPIFIKMNSDDFLEGGFKKDEMIQVASMLEKEGIDAIEISGGTNLSPEKYSFSRKTGIVSEDKEVYFSEAAALYKKHIKVPLILVGGIRSFAVAEKLITDGLADYISLCRPLIREPNLINRWKLENRNRSTCISCNQCFKPVRSGQGVYCVAAKNKYREKTEH